MPNPGGCATLEITIDLETGGACETCYAADESVLSRSCTGASVACEIITIPEPDCVVCAYVDELGDLLELQRTAASTRRVSAGGLSTR